MNVYISIAYNEIEGYVAGNSIEVTGIYGDEKTAWKEVKKYKRKHRYINQCDVFEHEFDIESIIEKEE